MGGPTKRRPFLKTINKYILRTLSLTHVLFSTYQFLATMLPLLIFVLKGIIAAVTVIISILISLSVFTASFVLQTLNVICLLHAWLPYPQLHAKAVLWKYAEIHIPSVYLVYNNKTNLELLYYIPFVPKKIKISDVIINYYNHFGIDGSRWIYKLHPV